MNMSWKRGACALMIVGILTGCSSTEAIETTETTPNTDTGGLANGQETAETPESGTVPLTVWAEEDNFEMLEEMIVSFQEHYAGQADFEISLVAQPDSETCNTILGDIHGAGDVFSFPDDQFTRLMSAGVLAPVDNAAEVAAANVAESIAAASWHDTLYAFPYTADNGYFLYYDKDYFTEEDVQTLDGLLDAANAAGKQISMELNSGWYLYAFFGQTGLELGVNSDGVSNYCNWNATEGAVKGRDVAQSILNLTTNPAFSYHTDDDFVLGVQDGSIIAGVSGTWNATQIRNAWGSDYGAVKLPTFTCAGQQIQMSSFTGYKMMGVNAYSSHKEWAMRLADWLTNEENQTIRFMQKSQIPSNIK
ncbi:MAG: extracellular solute-binding protein, partial [Lachnospiraceae bacterium]|nr:extracellular solute-binding protein [Lachnospiraceae bacterium]